MAKSSSTRTQKRFVMKGGGGSSSSSNPSMTPEPYSGYTILSYILMILIIILVASLIWFFWTSNKVSVIIPPQPNSTTSPQPPPPNNSKSIKEKMTVMDDDYPPFTGPVIPNPQLAEFTEYLNAKRHERIVNPLLPPERSYEVNYGTPINIPSRPVAMGYQQLGALYKENVNNEDSKIGNGTDTTILPLFGRPVYNGSKKWTYYTTSDNLGMIKLPINKEGRKCDSDIGCDEIYDGDNITIPAYNGNFKVNIYDYDKPKYIPYVW